MNERNPKQELSEQFVTDMVYFNFVRLAQTYGSKPNLLRIDASDLKPDAKTLSIEIPTDDPERPDILRGIDYGDGNNVIEIFYHKGNEAAKIYIKKGLRSGKTKMHTIKMFNKEQVAQSREGYVFNSIDINTNRPNIFAVYNLLQKAEVVLRKQEDERLRERFDKPKSTIKQRIFRRAQNLIE